MEYGIAFLLKSSEVIITKFRERFLVSELTAGMPDVRVESDAEPTDLMVLYRYVEPALTWLFESTKDLLYGRTHVFAWFIARSRMQVIGGCVVVGVPLVAAVVWKKRLKKQQDRLGTKFSSWIIDKFTQQVNVKRRTLFQNKLHVRQSYNVPGHSHGFAASIRTGCSHSIDDYICSTGKEPYVVSKGSRDEEERGQRLYYQTRDYILKYQDSPVLDTDVIKMIDVDYYADMDYWLSFGLPIVAYTFVPTKAGGSIPDSTFFIEKDTVHYKVNGGGTYVHKIWNYNYDYVTVDTACGVYVVAIDQMMTPEDSRRIVQLTPLAWIPAPLSFFVSRNPLSRVKYSYESWNFVRFQRPITGEQSVSLAGQGKTYSVTISDSLFESIQIRHSSSKSNKNIADIERFLRKDPNVQDPQIQASLLYAFLEEKIVIPRTEVIVGCGEVPTYQSLRPLVTESAKSYARKIGPELFQGSVVPGETFNNDVLTVSGRVKLTANNVVPRTKYNKFANDFVRGLSEIGMGAPWSVSDVMAHQDRPLQKVRSEKQRMWTDVSFLVKAFQKRESYQKIQDPRNISSVPTSHTLGLSRYTLAYKEQVLNKFDWFCPGKTPVEITRRLRDICDDEEMLLNADFSRLDGTISRWLRERIIHAALLRWFGDDPDLVKLLNSEANGKGVTTHGIRYETGYGQKSGSPLTTIGNTLVAAFFVYCALCEEGFSHGQAMALLGVLYGDDVVARRVGEATFNRVARELGLSIKIEIVQRGQPLTYLGRTFIDPWSTDTSMQDIKRTLSKIHFSATSAAEVTADTALMWKSYAYTITDPKTPILSDYCQAMLRLLNVNVENLDLSSIPKSCRRDITYWLQQEFEETWYQGDEIDVMRDVVCSALDIDGAECSNIIHMLHSAQSLTDITPRLSHLVPKVEIQAQINNEIVEPEEARPNLDSIVNEVALMATQEPELIIPTVSKPEVLVELQSEARALPLDVSKPPPVDTTIIVPPPPKIEIVKPAKPTGVKKKAPPSMKIRSKRRLRSQ